ncbi:MAG: phosphatase PAP2 family protein [Candidatus Thermoplasmatota archaeon]|nr:phosphatase PAP2 family protein [Candidatus Thermoplasmatota archaeon]
MHYTSQHLTYIIIIIAVVIFHLIEVNAIDPVLNDFINFDFATVLDKFEGGIVSGFSSIWNPGIVTFFVFIYIGVYPFTLWFSVLYFLITNNVKSMKTLAYGLFFIYLIALPFYLFIPVTNVYKFYQLDSPLNSVLPSVESFFYSLTTQNNCFPSLHTAMTILIAWCAYLTGNKKLSYFTIFCAITVIISVLYLCIHWITDVIAGATITLIVIILLKKSLRNFGEE